MKLILTLIILTGCYSTALAQHVFKALIKDQRTKEPLPGTVVNVEGTAIGVAADSAGLLVLEGVPAGRQVLHYRATGYKERFDTLMFPLPDGPVPTITMEADEEEMEEVVISSTRSSRTIEDIPTRVELIDEEEIGEKANMKPGDIKMILSESTGIQTLQTSATSGNPSIRIQGLDGRYTQVLKDGYPLYAGFSGGLGLMQTPPLDLKRVEIIKGASSTLYGGGAIAGLVNLISKTPGKEKELRLILNGTSAGGIDASTFYSKMFGKMGMTVYGAFNSNAAYAPDNTTFTAIPKFRRYTLNPKFFWQPDEKTEIVVGVNGMYENRIGGDIYYINGGDDTGHTFYEDNKTERISTTAEIKRRLNDHASVQVKNSIDHFNRIITTPYYIFDGTQSSTFTEANYSTHREHTEWVVGGNLFTDRFRERKLTNLQLRNYLLTTMGIFGQNTWDINKNFVLETGFRADYVMKYGMAWLPRISLLYKHGARLSSRLGGGFGYKAPNLFTEESERISYKNVLPVSPDSNKLERSKGVNWDVNYKTTIAGGKIIVNMNQLFFYTLLSHPLLLTNTGSGSYRFENSVAVMEAQGAETNIKMSYKHFKLFLGYTYTHSHIRNGDVYVETPLTPEHHTNSVLMYEVEGKGRVGMEAYYYSPQRIGDGTEGRDYWLCGFMAEKMWKHGSVYINFENILDSRQTRFDRIYTGPITKPEFRNIYAPLDGFIFNAGVKLSL